MKPKVDKGALEIFERLRAERLKELDELFRLYTKYQHKGDNAIKLRRTVQEMNRVRALSLVAALSFLTAKAVKRTEDALAYIRDERFQPYVHQVLENKFKCRDKQIRVAQKEFDSVLHSLLRDPLGIDGAGVTLGIVESDGLFAQTRPFFNSKTAFSSAMVAEALLDGDCMRDVNRAECLVFVKTLIHEAVHRLNFIEKDRALPNAARQAAQAMNELVGRGREDAGPPLERIGEIYEDDHAEAFRKLTCSEHLQNADSYQSFAGTMAEAYARVRGATVTSPQEEVEAYEARSVQEGDTLWWFAEIYYGDGTLWPVIWELNKETLKSGSPHRIYPKETVRIPLRAK